MKAEAYIKKLSLEEKISLLSETAPEIKRLGIKRYHHGNEALHGVVRPGKFTVFPQAIAMGAAFHPELIQTIAEAISDEARARHNANHGEMLGGDFDGLYNGLLTFWSPNLNTARDPRWGRTGETYGEDPYLCGACGTAFVKGLQGDCEAYLKTVATPKHFVGNNEEHNRFECNARIPEDQYRDYYLKPFEMAVKEGKCAAVMAAYNGVNGVPCHASHELLTDILRNEWGFDGYVVSDCGAVSHLVDRHHFANDPKEAAAMALRAGVDLECGSCGSILQVYQNYLKEAVDAGLVSLEDIDRAALRVLKARERLGILEDVVTPYDGLNESVIGCIEHQALALRAAEESVVLLKNDCIDGQPFLPLKKKVRICVVGNHAASCQFGDYSGTPVGHPISILEGLKEIYPEEQIEYIPYVKPGAYGQFQILEKENLFHYEGENKKPGLIGAYQSLKDGSTATRIDERIAFEWENMAPDPMIQKEHFKVTWSGVLIPKISGSYEFCVKANEKECACKGRYRLLLGGKEAHLGSFELLAGEAYPIMLEYENSGSRPSVMLLVKNSGCETGTLFRRETAAAVKCDVVIACLGLGTEYEAEGKDKTDLNLPEDQIKLLQAVQAVNPNVLVTLYNGSSLTIPWLDGHVRGILECWYPGEQGGRAIARIISGAVSPSGRLPLTFYKSGADLPSFQCYDISRGFTYWYAKDVLYPFGYGLSYTSFEYSTLTLSEDTPDLEGSICMTNTGTMAGYEVLQIYAKYMEGAQEPRRLVCVKKVWLEPGGSEIVTFSIPLSRFESYILVNHASQVWEGRYEISVGKNASEMLMSQERIWRENRWKSSSLMAGDSEIPNL